MLHQRNCNVTFRGLLFVCFMLYITLSVVQGKDCLGRDQCSCQFDDPGNSLVDLTSLGNTDGQPLFADVSAPDGNTYSYNPCYPFDDTGMCSNAAACYTDTVDTEYLIGAAQSAKFTYDDDSESVIVAYTAGSGVLQVTEVTLKCDMSACTPSLTAQGLATPGSTYTMTMTTVCACPNGCDDSGPVNPCSSPSSSSTFSKGAIFLIVLFTFMFIYFVGGTMFLKFGRKAQGVEIIPNVDFWKSFPFLIKDGVLFTLKPCLRLRKGYNEI